MDALPNAVDGLCRDVRAPRGLATFGYGNGDVEAIAEGAFAQQRLLAISPRPATRDDLATIVRQSLKVEEG
jgi:alcohol dehydrogenase class IV